MKALVKYQVARCNRNGGLHYEVREVVVDAEDYFEAFSAACYMDCDLAQDRRIEITFIENEIKEMEDKL